CGCKEAKHPPEQHHHYIDVTLLSLHRHTEKLKLETRVPRSGLITVSKRGVVSKLAALVRVIGSTVITGCCPTAAAKRPPLLSWYVSASGTTGTEPVSKIASNSVVPQPAWASPVSTLTLVMSLFSRFAIAKVASVRLISTEVTCCAKKLSNAAW